MFSCLLRTPLTPHLHTQFLSVPQGQHVGFLLREAGSNPLRREPQPDPHQGALQKLSGRVQLTFLGFDCVLEPQSSPCLATSWPTCLCGLRFPVPSPWGLLEVAQAAKLVHPPHPALALSQNMCPVPLLASPGHPTPPQLVMSPLVS